MISSDTQAYSPTGAAVAGNGGDLTPASAAPHPKPLVYACSGCSDAGELADRIARRLAGNGVAEMSCLAGIGGRVRSIMTKGEKAARILVIDGCPLNCARKTLELAGLTNFEHLGLHEVGLRKGHCPVTEEGIAAGVKAAQNLLQAPEFRGPRPSSAG
jgi:uncharacterized metal-binding protein